jgi:hypothetical protein
MLIVHFKVPDAVEHAGDEVLRLVTTGVPVPSTKILNDWVEGEIYFVVRLGTVDVAVGCGACVNTICTFPLVPLRATPGAAPLEPPPEQALNTLHVSIPYANRPNRG